MRHLYSFRGFYYFRSRVPSDLQGLFQCTLIKKSLKTKDFKTATSSVKLLSNELYRVIKVIRSEILNKSQLDKLVSDFLAAYINKRDTSRSFFSLGFVKSRALDLCDFHIKMYTQCLENNMPEPEVEELIKKKLKEANITLKDDSDDYLYMRKAFIMGLIEAKKLEKERINSDSYNLLDDFRSKRKTLPPAIPVSDSRLLTDTAEEFFKEKVVGNEWRSKTEEGNRSMFNLFHDIVKVILKTNVVYLHQIDRRVCVEYSEMLNKIPANMKKFYPDETIADILAMPELTKSNPISIKTRSQYIIFLSTFLLWCEDRGYISKNPAKGLIPKDTRKKNKIRNIFSEEDLTKLFNSPIYTEIDSSKPEKFFIPLISLYSGARLEEICQLYTEDIKEVDGIPCLELYEKHDKHIKSDAGERIIPIHPVIIKAGFLRYVESLRNRGTQKLWGNLKRKREKYSQDYSKWFTRYRRKHMTDDKKKTFHSFRHTLGDYLLQKGIDESLRIFILGQAQKTLASGLYGKDPKPALLLKILKTVDYGIDLSHLKFKIKKG